MNREKVKSHLISLLFSIHQEQYINFDCKHHIIRSQFNRRRTLQYTMYALQTIAIGALYSRSKTKLTNRKARLRVCCSNKQKLTRSLFDSMTKMMFWLRQSREIVWLPDYNVCLVLPDIHTHTPTHTEIIELRYVWNDGCLNWIDWQFWTRFREKNNLRYEIQLKLVR